MKICVQKISRYVLLVCAEVCLGINFYGIYSGQFAGQLFPRTDSHSKMFEIWAVFWTGNEQVCVCVWNCYHQFLEYAKPGNFITNEASS